MTAYSYTDWSSKSVDEQKNLPGISIPKTHPLNNPDRGAYWSGETAAIALSRTIERTLAGDDRVAARRMWNGLRQLHRQATESPRMVDRAMSPRQADAHAALGAYNGELDDGQLEQLTSVFDDVVSLQKEAQLNGVDPIMASRRMMSRAASRAVGYNVNDAAIEPELRPLVTSEQGAAVIANLNQSVAQLQALLTDRPLEDALDNIPQIGRDVEYNDELRDGHRRLDDILASVPLVLNPENVEPESNFSVRMESKQEATVMETIVRWTGEQERLPTKREIHRAFASWRDNGMSDSPYTVMEDQAVGIVSGSDAKARENLVEVVNGMGVDGPPLVVLTVEGNDKFRQALEATGRPVVDVTPEADDRGTHLSSRGRDLPANRIELIDLSADKANDPVERSLAANAVVGRVVGVGYVQGHKMNTVEAQAIHLAGTLRKLELGVAQNGDAMTKRDLVALRTKAREMDSEKDAQRYFTAGNARPTRGVNAVAFESSSKFDVANRVNAPGRDLIREAYDLIPANSTILTVDKDDKAVNRWLDANVENRQVLYAEATRKLSFAEIVDAGSEGAKRTARESETEFKIYDRPASQRSYGWEGGGKEGEKAENSAGVRRVCLDEPIEWDDQRVRGAIILVSGNAASNAINSGSQAIKVAQEAVMDKAHTGLLLTDHSERRASTDYHIAHMIRLANEQGKQSTVIDGQGREMGLTDARELSLKNAQSYSQKQEEDLDKQVTAEVPGERGRNSLVDVGVGDDLGQLALARLPGMDARYAVQMANSGLSLREIRTDKSDEMRKAIYDMGIPAATRAVINDVAPWTTAMKRATADLESAEKIGARLSVPVDQEHPIEQASGGAYRHAVFTVGEYDFQNQPLAAFIGNSDRYRQPGSALTLSEAQKAGPGAEAGQMVDPADTVDRPALRAAIREMSDKGYGIAVTLEEGVSRAVIEEAAHVPDARLAVMAPGNYQAASPELRKAVRTLFEQDRAAVVMPTAIAPHKYPDPKEGEERKPDVFVEDRRTMHDMIATASKIGVVVASGQKDQSLHIVRNMIDQEKPIAAMVPQNAEMAGTELYSGNMRMLRGKGRTAIESESLAQAPSANAFAEIQEGGKVSTKEDGSGRKVGTQTELVNGVRQGTSGSFQSARLGRNDNLRSGHHYQSFGWESAAHPISSVASIDRFVEKAEQGLGALGRYREPTERELERIRLDRDEQARNRGHNRVSAFVSQEFGSTSALHRDSIEAEAGRRIHEAGMEDSKYERVSADRQAHRAAAMGGHSMN